MNAGQHVVMERSSSTLQPGPQRLSGGVHQLELDRPLCLLLHDDSSVPNAPAGHDSANPHLDDITAAQLAVDRQVEQGSVTQSPLLV